ncbi:GGDEF domain-containing protein [Bacillus sp. 37MA]|uniref:GGDEF domain-containing protein n=1 Tax=Bacillus sp. 37MA TaxID=1132442 RepID=UPI0003702405|nr:GGDEF domain-containing protein [Bacillus sp. 37MA]
MGLKVDNVLSYRGRIISVVFIAVIYLFIRGIAIMYFGRALYPFPIPVLIPLVIAWYFGKQYDKYVHLSMRDTLTGLYNRRYVLDKFPRVMTYVNRRKLNIAILLLDVNEFKAINDNYGHDYGDQVLEHLSKILCKSFGQKDIIARWGGDEFLILSTFSDEKLVINKINQFKNEIKREDWQHKSDISVSIGKATYPLDADSLKDLMAKADSNMYELKMSGKQMNATKSEESMLH